MLQKCDSISLLFKMVLIIAFLHESYLFCFLLMEEIRSNQLSSLCVTTTSTTCKLGWLWAMVRLLSKHKQPMLESRFLHIQFNMYLIYSHVSMCFFNRTKRSFTPGSPVSGTQMTHGMTERAVRIVNQMNVAKETNLLVYKSKESKRKKSSKSALKIQPAQGGTAMWVKEFNKFLK